MREIAWRVGRQRFAGILVALLFVVTGVPSADLQAAHRAGHSPGGGGGGGGGGPGNGGGSEPSVCADPVPDAAPGADIVSVCITGGTEADPSISYEKRWRNDGTIDASDGISATEDAALSAELGGNFISDDDVGAVASFGATPAEIRSGWDTVLNEDFADPGGLADYSGALNYRRWSTKYAFSTDAKRNTISGEDDHWNVNTTGRYPGRGIGIENFYNNPLQLEFLDTLFVDPPGYPVFARVNDALEITAYRNPDPIRRINRAKPYLSGLISSAANPDGATPAHGFEFRYGYVESRLQLPNEGNGMRAALWLYSDNAFFNNVSNANLIKHEADILEYLPNNMKDAAYAFQPQLFGGVDNTARPDSQKILTYDTIFMTYHYDDFAARTPSDWTFNAEDRYRSRRAAAFDCDPATALPCKENFELQDPWVTVGLLWQPSYIEWYVNDQLIHRVVESGAEIPGFQHVAPVFDKRMYIIANLAMGLGVFEGPVDDGLFEPLSQGGKGPSVAFDYIRVYQNPASGHVNCGFDAGSVCDLSLGL